MASNGDSSKRSREIHNLRGHNWVHVLISFMAPPPCGSVWPSAISILSFFSLLCSSVQDYKYSTERRISALKEKKVFSSSWEDQAAPPRAEEWLSHSIMTRPFFLKKVRESSHIWEYKIKFEFLIDFLKGVNKWSVTVIGRSWTTHGALTLQWADHMAVSHTLSSTLIPFSLPFFLFCLLTPSTTTLVNVFGGTGRQLPLFS